MMKTKILNIVLIIAIFCSCSKKPDDKNNLNALLSTESAKAVVKSNSKFAFDFFKKVADSETSDNFMVSPLSLSMALEMTYNGAEGTTKTTFDKVLNHSQSVAETNQFNKNLIAKLSDNSDGSVMNIANAIWIKKQFPVKDEFITTNKNYYAAKVANLDFKDGASVNTINNWVSDKTQQKIPKIIKEISDDTVMFLINAIYFNANWKYKFDAKLTKKQPFYKTSSEPVQTAMMKMTGEDIAYTQNDLFSSVILPYKNDKFSMVVLLPKEEKTTDDIVNQLNAQNWEDWLTTYSAEKIEISIPKFKLNYEKKLNDDLTQMGLGVAFSGDADFSKMTDMPVKISTVLQKTFIDVNEKGTEAAAVTIVSMVSKSAGPGQSLHFNADKPFIYLIKENVTGSICFMGKVGNPKYEE